MAELFEELKKGNYEEIEISEGDILKISPDGTISKDIFEFVDYSAYGIYDWRSYGDGYYYDNDDYLTDLKDISRYYGYEPEDIDNFIREGFTLEEIEEYICS